MKQQQGFGALLLLILIAVVSISVALVASDRKRSAQAAEQVIQHAALQVQRIQEAALVYHSGWGVWPDNSDVLDQHDLVALTDLNTTFDSVMELSVEADEETQRFIISLDTHTDNQANTLANLVLNGQAVGNRVISSMPSPYDVTSYDDFLRRAESTAMPDGNTMEVDLDVAGYNLENVRDAQGQRLQANRLAADDMNSDDIQVDGYMDIGSARLQSTGSTLNVSSGFTTTGNMSAQLANLATVTTTGNVSGTNFTGDNFTASDVGANENQIYQELMQLQQDLDECMYEGDRPCMPQAPVISNVSCPLCDRSEQRSDFSATMSATVSNCRQGCAFSWAISNTLSGTCSAGTVTASQGSRNLSCTVSGTLEPQESLTGNVTLTARNSRNSSLATNTARNVSWTNTTPDDDPLDNMMAGCWVGTSAFNTVSPGNCSAYYHSPHHFHMVAFSVGDIFSSRNEYFTMSEPSRYSIQWSGDCTSTHSTCSRSGYTTGPNGTVFEATVKVTEMDTGRVWSRTVRAHDCTSAIHWLPGC